MGWYDNIRKRYKEASIRNDNLLRPTAIDFAMDLSRDTADNVRGQFSDIRQSLRNEFINFIEPEDKRRSKYLNRVFDRLDHPTYHEMGSIRNSGRFHENSSFSIEMSSNDMPSEKLNLMFIDGFNADVGISSGSFDYDALSLSVDALDFDIPKDVHQFKELNSKLYNESHKDHKTYLGMANQLNQFRQHQEPTVTIEGPPYVVNDRKSMDRQGVKTEYSGERLELLQALARQASSDRAGESVTMGDFTYAHMQFVKMEKYEPEVFHERVKSVRAINIAPINLQATKTVEQNTSTPKQHVAPSWDERLAQYRRENPKPVVEPDLEVEPEHVFE